MSNATTIVEYFERDGETMVRFTDRDTKELVKKIKRHPLGRLVESIEFEGDFTYQQVWEHVTSGSKPCRPDCPYLRAVKGWPVDDSEYLLTDARSREWIGWVQLEGIFGDEVPTFGDPHTFRMLDEVSVLQLARMVVYSDDPVLPPASTFTYYLFTVRLTAHGTVEILEGIENAWRLPSYRPRFVKHPAE